MLRLGAFAVALDHASVREGDADPRAVAAVRALSGGEHEEDRLHVGMVDGLHLPAALGRQRELRLGEVDVLHRAAQSAAAARVDRNAVLSVHLERALRGCLEGRQRLWPLRGLRGLGHGGRKIRVVVIDRQGTQHLLGRRQLLRRSESVFVIPSQHPAAGDRSEQVLRRPGLGLRRLGVQLLERARPHGWRVPGGTRGRRRCRRRAPFRRGQLPGGRRRPLRFGRRCGGTPLRRRRNGRRSAPGFGGRLGRSGGSAPVGTGAERAPVGGGRGGRFRFGRAHLLEIGGGCVGLPLLGGLRGRSGPGVIGDGRRRRRRPRPGIVGLRQRRRSGFQRGKRLVRGRRRLSLRSALERRGRPPRIRLRQRRARAFGGRGVPRGVADRALVSDRLAPRRRRGLGRRRVRRRRRGLRRSGFRSLRLGEERGGWSRRRDIVEGRRGLGSRRLVRELRAEHFLGVEDPLLDRLSVAVERDPLRLRDPVGAPGAGQPFGPVSRERIFLSCGAHRLFRDGRRWGRARGGHGWVKNTSRCTIPRQSVANSAPAEFTHMRVDVIKRGCLPWCSSERAEKRRLVPGWKHTFPSACRTRGGAGGSSSTSCSSTATRTSITPRSGFR